MPLVIPVLPLLFALSLSASPPGERALLVDIQAADAAEVEALKHGAGVQWWLELGNRLLIAGELPANAALSRSTPVLEELAGLRLDELALRAVGCNEHADPPGELLARGGRWQLRRLAAGEALPRTADAHERWRALQPNEVIARQYRLDAPFGASPPDADVQAVVDRIDTARWFADLTQLASWDRSSYGTTELFAARDWIGDQFAGLGLEVEKPDFTMPDAGGGSITRQNVIGRWTGTTFPDEWIVVGGHYDSRNQSWSSTGDTPGAEDNASGCTGVIELARALLPSQPQRTIVFMCYAGEEQGLYGSAAHVDALQADGDLGKVKGVVVMDMIGYSANAQLNADYESYSQAYLNRFGAAAATYAPELDVVTSLNPFGSDHMPYLDAGVDQTALGIESDYDSYPYYHHSGDTPEHIGPNAQAMGGAILKTNAAVLADLAGLAETVNDRIFADDFD